MSDEITKQGSRKWSLSVHRPSVNDLKLLATVHLPNGVDPEEVGALAIELPERIKGFLRSLRSEVGSMGMAIDSRAKPSAAGVSQGIVVVMDTMVKRSRQESWPISLRAAVMAAGSRLGWDVTFTSTVE